MCLWLDNFEDYFYRFDKWREWYRCRVRNCATESEKMKHMWMWLSAITLPIVLYVLAFGMLSILLLSWLDFPISRLFTQGLNWKHVSSCWPPDLFIGSYLCPRQGSFQTLLRSPIFDDIRLEVSRYWTYSGIASPQDMMGVAVKRAIKSGGKKWLIFAKRYQRKDAFGCVFVFSPWKTGYIFKVE